MSNVLNARDSKVSPATRERVLAAVRDLNYQPSPAVLRDEPQGTRNLVVLLPRPSNPTPGSDLYLSSAYMNALIDGMLEESARHGWSLTFLVQPDADSDEAWLQKFVDGRCEGVILVNQRRPSPVEDELAERGVAVACLGSHPDGSRAAYIDVDNVEAARTVTRYLMTLGHRRIVHIAGDPELTSAQDRAAGYRVEMELAGLAEDAQVVWADYAGSKGYEVALGLRSEPDRPSALFCSNDHIADGALRAARELELRVPEDLSIVGFDDAPFEGREPILTTVRQPLRRMGARAVSTLIARSPVAQSAEKKAPAKSILLAGDLVVRRTTGPAPGNPRENLHPRFQQPTEV